MRFPFTPCSWVSTDRQVRVPSSVYKTVVVKSSAGVFTEVSSDSGDVGVLPPAHPPSLRLSHTVRRLDECSRLYRRFPCSSVPQTQGLLLSTPCIVRRAGGPSGRRLPSSDSEFLCPGRPWHRGPMVLKVKT